MQFYIFDDCHHFAIFHTFCEHIISTAWPKMTKKATTNSTSAALHRTRDEKTTQFYLFSITCSAFDTLSLSLSLCLCACIACMQMHAQEDRQTITCELTNKSLPGNFQPFWNPLIIWICRLSMHQTTKAERIDVKNSPFSFEWNSASWNLTTIQLDSSSAQVLITKMK